MFTSFLRWLNRRPSGRAAKKTAAQPHRSRRLGCEALEERALMSVAGAVAPIPATTSAPQFLSVTAGSPYASAYGDLGYGSNNNYITFNHSGSLSSTGTANQNYYGYYYNGSYANSNAGGSATQTVTTTSLGLSTSAYAYSNPVAYGKTDFASGFANDSINFTVPAAAVLTFSYNTGAYATTAAGVHGVTAHAASEGYAEVINSSNGQVAYAQATATANNGGGPYNYSYTGSFSVTLPAGHYTLYGFSSSTTDGVTGASASGSSYNNVSLVGVRLVTSAVVTKLAATPATAATPAAVPTSQPSAANTGAALASLDALFASTGFNSSVSLQAKHQNLSGDGAMGTEAA
jgi:hypothetical protein